MQVNNYKRFSKRDSTILRSQVGLHIGHGKMLKKFLSFLASEIQHFLLYYGLPLLKPFLHNECFHHLALLTTAMWLLVKKEVTLEDVNMAKDLLDSFCRLMKSFYGMYSWYGTNEIAIGKGGGDVVCYKTILNLGFSNFRDAAKLLLCFVRQDRL